MGQVVTTAWLKHKLTRMSRHLAGCESASSPASCRPWNMGLYDVDRSVHRGHLHLHLACSNGPLYRLSRSTWLPAPRIPASLSPPVNVGLGGLLVGLLAGAVLQADQGPAGPVPLLPGLPGGGRHSGGAGPLYMSHCTAEHTGHTTMLPAVQCWGLNGRFMMRVRLTALCIILGSPGDLCCVCRSLKQTPTLVLGLVSMRPGCSAAGASQPACLWVPCS